MTDAQRPPASSLADLLTDLGGASARALCGGFGLGAGASSPSGQLYEADAEFAEALGLAGGALPTLLSLAADHEEASALLDWLTEREEASAHVLALRGGRRVLLLRTGAARAHGTLRLGLLALPLGADDLCGAALAPAAPTRGEPAATPEVSARVERAFALARVVGGFAHDINNQLMVLMSGAYLLQSLEAANDDAQAALTEMTEATQRASELAGALQSLTSPDAGESAPFDLGRRLLTSRKLLLRALGSEVSASVAADPDAGTAHLSDAAWGALLLSAAWGVRQALGEGGSLHVQALPAASLAFTLRGGDAAAALSAEPFACGGPRTLRDLCAALGVTAEATAPDTLTLRLPRAPLHRAAPSAQRPAQPAPARSLSLRVLVVAPSPESLEALTRLLVSARHQVVAVQSAGDALLAAEVTSSPPLDAVVTLDALPWLRGGALIRRLWSRAPNLGAVLLGAGGDEPAPTGARSLPWPAPPEDLLRALRAVAVPQMTPL